ncbi:Fc receptor-like protein 5 [Cheilinus undulatus]|uniref:Fc receptor-like protein 5 n=1 Tax=Cheilinus undulatus TaxID=241271 RepID=UPI001BD1DFE7|nr:Fc receptor-like protein 5 [Cheilinus undulatus]
MHSTVMKNLHAHLLPILALASLLVKISGSTSLHPVLTGPDLAYLSSRVAFRCLAPDSSPPVIYELMRDGGVPISTATDDQGDQPAPFFLKVTASSEGSYHCRATAGGNTGVSNIIRLSVVTPASNTIVVPDPSPPVIYEGSHVILSCNVSKGSHLQYTWFFNRKELTSSTSSSMHLTGNKLVLENVTPEHAGNYYCMAWSQVQDIRRFSSSSEVQVTVKVYVSKPRISFYIFKEGDSYRGNVTCWSTRGSPPVNFSLLLAGREEGSVTATESLITWFTVAMVPGLDMGVAQCQVKSHVQELTSEPLTLEVVPVGGDVRVEVEYFYRAGFKLAATLLHCKVSRGTFPHITWLFNESVLPSETLEGSHNQPISPHYAVIGRSQTLVLAKLGPEESGYYRCRVRNSYDDSGPWVESDAVLVRATAVLITTMEVISIVLCCFVLLMLIVGAALIYKISDQKQAHVQLSTTRADAADLTVSEPASQSADRQDNMNDVQNQKELDSMVLLMFSSVFVVILGLCCCSQGNSQSLLGRPQLFGPSEAQHYDVVEFKCQVKTYPKNEAILLQLYKEGNRDKLLSEYTSLKGEIAIFPLVIKSHHDGNLECLAKAQNNSKIEPTVSHTHHLKVVVPVKVAELVVASGPVEFFEGKMLELRCDLTEGNYVSYSWLLNGQPVSQSPHHRAVDNQLQITRTTSSDSGLYMCVATNTFNNTKVFSSNSSVTITVKDTVSKPDISFSVSKEDSHYYYAVVTCQSMKGSPPITFSLYNSTELIANMTTKDTVGIFRVPLVLGEHLGKLRCRAVNGDQTAYSKWIPLKVVPVKAPVMMDYKKTMNDHYAVISLSLYCKAAKGTHPRYQWFLNDTLLQGQGSFYHVVHQPPESSVLLLSVGASSAGTYHCEVSDSFDNTTTISSRRHYLDEDVLNRLPFLVVVVVFGCFIFMVLLVTVCCGVGVMLRRRQNEEKFLGNMEMERVVPAFEGELDVTNHEEDADLVRTARGSEFDQASSDVSVDEWPQIVREKRTLEDEAVEEL